MLYCLFLNTEQNLHGLLVHFHILTIKQQPGENESFFRVRVGKYNIEYDDEVSFKTLLKAQYEFRKQARQQQVRSADNPTPNRPRSVRFVRQIFEWGKVAIVTACHLSMGCKALY